MKDWFIRNVEGLGIAVFIIAFLLVYGIGSLFHKGVEADNKRAQYIVEHNLVHIDGYIRAEDLQHIKLQETN